MVDVVAYPAHWEADILLKDGSTMRVRPIVPGDADALQAFHVAQSEESTYFRFFAPLRRLSDRDLRRLVKVDHRDRVALVVVSGESIVAVARYDRISQDRAEVAFNVADTLQGQGLGSTLLEHLAAAARERGVSVFQADVLPGNAKMIRVFSDAGYDVVQRYEDGVITLEFTIDPTHRSLEVVASREHRTDAASMRQFMNPRGIVLVADDVDADLVTRVAENLGEFESVTFIGEGLREIARHRGQAWLASTAELDSSVGELALVAGSPQQVIGWLEPLARRGVRGVVVYSDGFTSDDGEASQQQLLRAARSAGVRLVGPRSWGLVSQRENGILNASLSATSAAPGQVALFTQSASIARAVLAEAERSALGVATFVSAGHRADVSGNDLLQYAADLPEVGAVALYLESLGNARKFARVAQRVSESIPVVAVVGASQRESHGNELGRRAVAEAMLAAGVVVTPTLRAMVETSRLLVTQPLPRGSRIAIVTNSAAVADLAAAQVHHLDPDPVRRVVNWRAGSTEIADTVADLLADEGWDCVLVLYTPPVGDASAQTLVALEKLATADRPALAVVPGMAGFTSVEDAVAALTRFVRYATWRRSEQGSLVEPTGLELRAAREVIARELSDVQPGQQLVLGPDATADLLGCLGIEVLPTRVVRSPRDAMEAALELGWPIAVKSSDPQLRRRPDLGGVRLDVSGPLDLVDAIRQVRSRQGGSGPVLLQRMAPLGVACLVKGSVDPLLGPVVSFGLTGDATDLLDDAGYALPPLRTGEVHRLVNSVRAAARLRGDGPTPGANIAAVEDLVARVADAIDALPQVHTLELRPVLAGPEAAVVLDARVVLATEVRPDGARRALRG